MPKCHEILQDVVGHFVWRHVIHKSDMDHLRLEYFSVKHVSVSIGTADGIASLGPIASTGTISTKLYKTPHLKG